MNEQLLSKKNVVVTYYPQVNYIHIDWIGFQREQEIYDSGEEVLQIFQKLDCHKVLNDNRKVIGPWNKAAGWTQDYWFPEMIKAGLTHFAWVFPDNVFAELSANQAMPDTDIVHKFMDYNSAEQWLKTVTS
ncbi:hypothetical protein BKI52_42415 [marine bacterium AO1-C]|nr:hypothetical protein BKI52_42415 [marine bacterium AO1-C]